MEKMKNKLGDLRQRLLVSGCAILVVIGLISFSENPFVKALLVLTLAFLAAVGVWEYAQLVKAKGFYPATKWMVTVAFCEVVAFYVSLAYPEWAKIAHLVIVLGFISFFVAHFRDTTNAVILVAVELFSVCYVAIPFSFMLAILHPFPHQAGLQDGRWWLFYVIAVTKITDVGGYFIGKLFGKHPLARQLSPKKTIEGALGGFMFAIILSLLLALLAKVFSITSFHLTLFNALWMGGVIGILGQIGDLGESLLKRDAVVKDSNTLPGLGGVLDMLDSLLFTTPVVYFFIRL